MFVSLRHLDRKTHAFLHLDRALRHHLLQFMFCTQEDTGGVDCHTALEGLHVRLCNLVLWTQNASEVAARNQYFASQDP